jgi:hypothetical protein
MYDVHSARYEIVTRAGPGVVRRLVEAMIAGNQVLVLMYTDL